MQAQGIFNMNLKANKWHSACQKAAKMYGLVMVEDKKAISIYNFTLEVGEDGKYINTTLRKVKKLLEKQGIKVSKIMSVSTEPHIDILYKDCSGGRKQ